MQTASKLLPTVGDEVVLFVVEDFIEWGGPDPSEVRSKYEPHRVEILCKFIAVQDGLVWVTIDSGSVGFPLSKVEINFLPKLESSEDLKDGN